MSKIRSAIVQIAHTDKQELPKAKKLFNKLIKQIERQKKELVDWQAIIPIYQQKYSSEFLPLITKLNEYREKMIYLFDDVYENKKITQTEKLKISGLICATAPALIIDNNSNELKQIYNKHSRSDFDAEKQDMHDEIKLMMKEMLGVDIAADDIDLNSPELLYEKVAREMQQKFEQAEERPEPKKSAKTLAKEAAQKQAEQEISQSIKDVYRQLASSLHPDKEQDSLERTRKTLLMQRTNMAYTKKDLLGLLELQLEVEQIDQSVINNMPEERVMHYNKVLSNQASEIKQEISAMKHAMQCRFSKLLAEMIESPTKIMENLHFATELNNVAVSQASLDLELFQDLKNVKNFLKEHIQ